jgi:hypothetical protein
MMNFSKYLVLALSLQASSALFAAEPLLKQATAERDCIEKERRAKELESKVITYVNQYRTQSEHRGRVTVALEKRNYNLLSREQLASLMGMNIHIELQTMSIVRIHQ